MFDIDRYLDDICIKDMTPDDELITRTKKRCEDEALSAKKNGERRKKVRDRGLIAIPVAGAIILGAIIVMALLANNASNYAAAAYYTVDINPSICVNVDTNGNVTGIRSQNDDAAPIVKGLSEDGKPVAEAIGDIITAVHGAGYLNGNNGNYVLVGCFAADGTKIQSTVDDLQAALEEHFGDMINLLIVQGNLKDFSDAGQLHVSAGLLRLSKLAQSVTVSDGDKVADVYSKVQCENEPNYCAPSLSVSAGDGCLNFSWNKIDFDEMGYTGNVKYMLAGGDSYADVSGMSGTVYKTLSFNSYGSQKLSAALDPSDGISAGGYKYYALYAQYGDTKVCSNVVSAQMPSASASPTPTATVTSGPSDTPGPSATPPPDGAHKVTGKVSGSSVVLSWSKDTTGNLSGYKVVASETNPNPKYPDDGYLKYITDASTTSISMQAGSYGLKANTYYYFSITYLYNGGSTVAGNAVKLKVPEKPDTTGTDDSYPVSNISGSIDGDTVHLHWTKVNDSRFTYYKIVYSFSDSSPSYSSCGYIRCYDDPGTTSCDICTDDLDGGSPGAKCYFAVTVLYNGGDVQKTCKAISLTMPGDTEPDDPYSSTDISGYISGSTVHLSWNKIDDSRFEFYKVVYSFSDSSPSYPADNYVKYYSSADVTHCRVYANSYNLNGYTPGATCWFAITVVYQDGTKKTGSSVAITMPDEAEPTASPTDTECPTDTPTDTSECSYSCESSITAGSISGTALGLWTPLYK